MALSVPTFPNPFDPENPIANAYAWLSLLAVDLAVGAGRIVLSVHPRESAWQAPPVGTIEAHLGSNGFPTLATLMADPEFRTAFDLIGAKLYAAAVAHVPNLAGSTPA